MLLSVTACVLPSEEEKREEMRGEKREGDEFFLMCMEG